MKIADRLRVEPQYQWSVISGLPRSKFTKFNGSGFNGSFAPCAKSNCYPRFGYRCAKRVLP